MRKNSKVVLRDADVTESVTDLLGHAERPDVKSPSIAEGRPLGKGAAAGTAAAAAAAAAADYADDDEDERPAWGSKLQYILAQVGFSVGLGNVWRFPYLCQKNGGGAYLVPYVILLFVLGIPLFFLELAAGQLIRRGSVGVWSYINSKLGGIGFASCMVCYFVALYYNVIISWALYYFFHSFQYPLPWANCPVLHHGNITEMEPECKRSSATTYYWYRQALDISDSISHGGGLNWRMTLCLFAAWLIVALAMIRGIQSSGKVMYFSSLFPYLVLFCFLVRGLLLDGAMDGIRHMFMPKLEMMAEPQVWREAATQVFFALGLGFGGVIAFSSYNKRDNNCHFDAVLVSVINFLTSLLATLVVFAILGFKANVMNESCVTENWAHMMSLVASGSVSITLIPSYVNLSKPSVDDYKSVYDVVKIVHKDDFPALGLLPCLLEDELNKAVQGTGLAFIAFTEAITHFPMSPFWSLMFFMMLLSLGLGSMFGTMEGLVTPIVDTFKIRKEIVTLLTCAASFLVGLVFVQRSGNYFVTMFDDYSATLPLTVVVILENTSVAWLYGTDKFMDDIKDMIGFAPPRIYYYMWRYFSPLAMIAMLVASVTQMCMQTPGYHAWIRETATEEYLPYPPWALAMLSILIVLALLPVPLVILVQVIRARRPDPSSLASVSFRRRKILEENSPLEERDSTSLLHSRGYRQAQSQQGVGTVTVRREGEADTNTPASLAALTPPPPPPPPPPASLAVPTGAAAALVAGSIGRPVPPRPGRPARPARPAPPARKPSMPPSGRINEEDGGFSPDLDTVAPGNRYGRSFALGDILNSDS
ncbi:sodium-dependent neutral amino acid transporter B(0)AT2-like [Lethenteron reissneri]|uniref:sodium-dependent neutral amino acid transporter B(0)AT2-like n=1 Tax=Lethenteron reissneri TaxID=7753 RepID=UPI002AB67542|nr:sodium-dependent neutral amino acid transporter B(0)AT2-like [Lethenteron reissneri]XP_061415881.1 sodium-dependent neutral amino acid transporter B(0)AT2-like [Lethenteron reissneri]XP_061415882.1 sodium-dependent neutral amino acid transporter B(0)AT2-like [Lethenteron reissneri]XP_061415883.1 sodium-dependent neutral amino acid transporter B(0)AT2-like [Lethenteron reissneri]XP_061415884.1 sodium-dependent neutral amino acid transporter B(0)AT2-like [Lethenteron reissneri]